MPAELMAVVLFGALLHAGWNVLVRSATDKLLDALLVVAGAGVLAAVSLPFLPAPRPASWPYLAASVLIHAGYFTFVALSYRAAAFSFAYPLMRGSAPVLSSIAVVLWLGEAPSARGAVGVALVSAGVLLLTADAWRQRTLHAGPTTLALANAGVIEIQCIKDVIEPPNRGKLIVQNGLKVILAYWPIFSVIVALGTILYVRTVFGVDYFENYRSIATTKKLSQFYSQMGDKLLYQQEWEAAEDAYQKSLEIDKNNVNATYGIAKAQVFQPLEGQQYYVNEIVLTKLDYLLESFPEDYQVYFLKGLYFQNQNDFANARAMYNMAIMKNPRFDDGFLSLGYLSMQDLDLSSSIGYFEKTLQIEPGNTLANNNVGFCYLILLDFNGAIPHLEQAWQISPSLLTLINLA